MHMIIPYMNQILQNKISKKLKVKGKIKKKVGNKMQTCTLNFPVIISVK